MFEKEFEGKVVLVTGGSTGIGYATVKSFLATGAKVYFLGKPGEDLTKQTEELKAINPDYDFASNTNRPLQITKQLRHSMLRLKKNGVVWMFWLTTLV